MRLYSIIFVMTWKIGWRGFFSLGLWDRELMWGAVLPAQSQLICTHLQIGTIAHEERLIFCAGCVHFGFQSWELWDLRERERGSCGTP